MPDTMLKLKVAESLAKDMGRALARLDPADMQRLGLQVGDVVEIRGKRATVGKVMPAYKDQRGQARLQIDGVTRENAAVGLGQLAEVSKVQAQPAERVVLAPATLTPSARDLRYIGGLLDGLTVVAGDLVRASLFGARSVDFRVASTAPAGPVFINPTTLLEVAAPAARTGKPAASPGPSYEDVGGLRREVHRVREIIELPLRYPELFERLGIDAPKGVLLHGPPGCGKTLIARAVAHETEAKFFAVNGPEIMHKFVGESEGHLRKIFEEATRQAPSIIFLDELDAIAPRRENVTGEVEKRVVAQLLALMDGLARRNHVMVIAATNLPNALDPALRRPGRFDREISISIPDRNGRKEILGIHSRGMPLAADVDLNHLAAITHGFVGADLQALCREAAMICLRRLLPEIDFSSAQVPYEALSRLEVTRKDFQEALREVEPSAVREVFVEVPSVRWDDIGGLTAVKQQLIEAVVWPLKHAELFTQAGVKPPRGILLSGPPGCGKTLLAKAAASETEVNFIPVKGPSLLSKYVGESEKGVREVFRKARQAAPCIVFLDEVDALAPARGAGSTDSHVAERVLAQLLAEMDGVEELNGVLVLAATNRPDMLDPAVLRPGRFDVHLSISAPDQASREEIFAIGLRDKPIEPGVDVADLAARSAGLTGAEIQGVCQQAALAALRAALAQAAEAPRVLLRREHLDQALTAARARKRG